MITKTLKSLVFILALSSLSAASAQDKLAVKDKSEKMFKHLDLNADNIISLGEFKSRLMKDESKAARIEQRFKALDTDNNGKLTKEEYKAVFDNPRLQQQEKSNTLEKKKG